MRVKHDITTKYCVQIGDPLDYACATYVHNIMYNLCNQNAICLCAEIPKGGLPDLIAAVKTLHFIGFDLTMPHKTDIIDYLDECEESSRVFKCVNHVKLEDGKLIGVGLDGVGMGMAIAHAGTRIEKSRVLMLGAGAVSGPIAAELCKRGAASVTVLNRTPEKARYLSEVLHQHYNVPTAYDVMHTDTLRRYAPEHNLVVQCTSLGAAGHSADYDNVDFIDLLPEDATVADVLYPSTSILDRARARGLRAVNGMGMLAQQQFALMKFRFGIDLPESALYEVEEAVHVAVAMRDLRLRTAGR
nr:saccharopine dehydrogenase NADP-binding domain-containing protein [Maliibacterium massiliense]